MYNDILDRIFDCELDPRTWPKIYVCSPYAGNVDKNVDAARSYCRFVVDKAGMPVAPHLLFPQFLDDEDVDERKLGLIFAKKLLEQCDEIWIFGDRLSCGMFGEYQLAKLRNMRMRFFDSDFKETTASWLEV